MSVMGLLQHPGKVKEGEVHFRGENLLNKSQKEMRKITVCKECDHLFVHTDRRVTCKVETIAPLLRNTQDGFFEKELPEKCPYKMEQMVLNQDEI